MPDTSVPQRFQQQFPGAPPLLVRAPGRINLIGEHTDYNAGLVLPAAIDLEISFAVRLNETGRINLVASDLDETYAVAADAVAPGPLPWANYLLGVVAQLQARGHAVPGFDCVFGGRIPLGAGLSSSAAIECGLAFALNELLALGLSRLELARVGQLAEHTYAGVQCGIMDQFASLHGRAGQVLRLDCRSLAHEYFALDTGQVDVVLCNSGVKHELADTAYNTRRAECYAGVAVLRRFYPEVQSLRDATLPMLAALHEALRAAGPDVYRRCAYVVRENLRVEATTQALLANDLTRVGRLLYDSHAGLRRKYEVSCPELDALVAIAWQHPAVYGARMMGGGFGGCTINLVRAGEADAFAAHATAAYQQQLGLPLETYQVRLVDGVSVVEG